MSLPGWCHPGRSSPLSPPSGKLLSTWRMMFSLSLTADDVGCDLPLTEPDSFHGRITVSATEASLLLDPEYGMLYRQNSDMTSALDSLGANWSRIFVCLAHSTTTHCDTLISCALEISLLTNLLTYLVTSLAVRDREMRLDFGRFCRSYMYGTDTKGQRLYWRNSLQRQSRRREALQARKTMIN